MYECKHINDLFAYIFIENINDFTLKFNSKVSEKVRRITIEYKIKIFSSLGCKFDSLDFSEIKKYRKEDSIKIDKQEKIGSLDISDLFNLIYEGFDGILVIILGKVKGGKFISEYNSFQKIVNEANKILERRGFSNQRITLLHLNGNDYKKLNEEVKTFFNKIIKCGQNPINNEIIGSKHLNQEKISKVV